MVVKDPRDARSGRRSHAQTARRFPEETFSDLEGSLIEGALLLRPGHAICLRQSALWAGDQQHWPLARLGELMRHASQQHLGNFALAGAADDDKIRR